MATVTVATVLREDHYVEKRQLFLRSYQFSRKRATTAERLRSTAVRVWRLILLRLRGARYLLLLLRSLLRSEHRRRRFFHYLSSLHHRGSAVAGCCYKC
ncbi:hypothetical protein HPP92_017312 [Vanilla planifolia]|uniref:Uncharacterized protein n=1 Tax=Vanilla planifolia TaxID=51239 RepID=A0A835QKL9_VANPL|nr:hypothetical protein HPP92_017312 [Vanilla planifolia]